MTEELVDSIRAGGIGVLATDTLYGIHADALNRRAVEKVYKIRYRDTKKPFIILISSTSDLKKFKIQLTPKIAEFLEKYWPGSISIVLPCPHPEFTYLHRGTKTLAFRLPDKKALTDLIQKTGPLISTSVNPEGKEPAKTIAQAKKYFGDKLDFYADQGHLDSPPSTVVKLDEKGKSTILRPGAVKINS